MKYGRLLKDESSLNYYNVVAALPAGRLAEIAARPDVVSIQPRPTPHKTDERQDMIISGNLTAAGLLTGPGYLTWLEAHGFTQAQITATVPTGATSGTTVDLNTTTTLQVHDNTPVTGGTPRYLRLQVTRP